MCFLFWSGNLFGQLELFLQLEHTHTDEVVKFYPGDKITFSTPDLPDEWQTSRIKQFKPELNLIVFESGYLEPSDIHSIKLKNKRANLFGHLFSKFGTAWVVFGAIAVAQGDDISVSQYVIGGVAIALGWLLRKVFGKKKIKMGKRNRLRIMDIRFPSPSIQTP